MKYEPAYYINKYKKHIFFWTAFIIVIASIISFASWQDQMDQRRGKTEVAVQTVPRDASIKINNIDYPNKNIYLKPGRYTIKVYKEDFYSHSQELIVNDIDNPKVYIGLLPKNDKAKKWQARHRAQYTDLENQSFKYAQEYGEKFQNRWPITKTLPIKDPYFTVSYKVNEHGNIIITVKGTSPRYREFAIQELRKRGFEPTDYRFEFIGFSNPLKKGDL